MRYSRAVIIAFRQTNNNHKDHEKTIEKAAFLPLDTGEKESKAFLLLNTPP